MRRLLNAGTKPPAEMEAELMIGKKIICVKTMCPVTFTCHDLRVK